MAMLLKKSLRMLRHAQYHSARIDPWVRYPTYSHHTFECKIESKMML